MIRSFDIAVFSQSNQMIGDGVSSFFRGYDDVYDDLKSHPYYQRSIFSKTFEWIEQPRPFTDSIFLLYSPWSHNNYYYFMIDLLPRAKFAQEVSYHERNLSTLLTFSPNSYQREALNRVGIENLNILQELTLHLQAPKIYCIAQTRSKETVSSFCVNFVRSLFSNEIEKAIEWKGTQKFPNRIFIARESSVARPLINQTHLASSLASFGFKVIYLAGLSISEQASLFATADLVVGQHGAGLTNVVFCSALTNIVEFHGAWFAPYFQAIAKAIGAKYYSYRCFEKNNHALEVDIDDFILFLRNNKLL